MIITFLKFELRSIFSVTFCWCYIRYSRSVNVSFISSLHLKNKMFTKSDPDTTSFPSTWKIEKKLVSGSTQTDEQSTIDAESQVFETDQASTQTEEEVIPEIKNPKFDESSLLAFLQRITPQVEKEIEKSNRSRAFASYSDLDGATNLEVKCLHTLRGQHVPPEHSVADIKWSSTGSVIAVAYGLGLHEDWCSHKGAVAVWNINRHDFTANSPEQVMDTSTCITSLSFHPSNPAFLAAGAMSGEVTLFDLSKTQEANSFMPGDSGGVAITCLCWVPGPTGDSYRHGVAAYSIASATAGGTILIWDVVPTKEIITLRTGYLVASQDVPREVRSRLSDSGGVGLTSMTFGVNDSSTFILGTEGGAVLLCSTSLKELSGTVLEGVNLMKCVTSSLAPHSGRVLDASFSPFHRHAVHTLGSDNNVKLFSLLQTNRPVTVIYSEAGVTCSRWSTSRPLVTAVGKVEGDVSFYNFENKNCEPLLQLPSAEKASPISSLSFNHKNFKLVAVGDQLGRVFIWELPANIVSPASSEQSMLDSMVQIAAD